MPTAAISAAIVRAFEIASRAVATVVVQMCSGSCSTQPEAGKCCGNSRCPNPTGFNASSKTIARLDVVPWSKARILAIAEVPVAPRATLRRSLTGGKPLLPRVQPRVTYVSLERVGTLVKRTGLGYDDSYGPRDRKSDPRALASHPWRSRCLARGQSGDQDSAWHPRTTVCQLVEQDRPY